MEPLNEQKLLEILLHEHYITEEDAQAARTYAAGNRGSARDYLASHGIITPDLIGQAIAELYFLPYADLNSHPPTHEQVMRIPEDLARTLRVVLFGQDADKSTIATDRPNQELEARVQPLFPGKHVAVAYALTEDIDAAFVQYRKPLATRFSELLKTKKAIAPELLNQLFEDALSFHASDIHFESEADRIAVRFRVDGVLSAAGALSRDLYEMIVNRIKVLAHLRTDEHVTMQDGAIRWVNGEQVVDMRVSIVPTIEGENVVIRLLSSYIQSFALTDLGFTAKNQQKVAAAAQKPFGMILVTGPTGSGKSTTLYALLKILNQPGVNITTIEDPVEYRVVGVNQIQVNPATGLTFAKGLRSIIRQDPNIILVGEIRDTETAEIAVNAALTGHLLLSTFHANDAATAIPRLLDMNVEPFLLASTLELVIAQRLVRKICESCRVSQRVDPQMLARLPGELRAVYEKAGASYYKGKGCAVCGGTGYKGRTAIFEIIEITDEMEELMLTNPSARAVSDLSRTQGSVSLFDDGIEKVKNGITTPEELLRVATPPQATT